MKLQYIYIKDNLLSNKKMNQNSIYFLSSNAFSYFLIVYFILSKKVPFKLSKSTDGYLSHLKHLFGPDVS